MFCKIQLVELEGHLAKIREEGFGVAAISYDSVAVLKNFSNRKNITFPLLSDRGSKIIRSFGILDETIPKSSPLYGIPHMESYLVGPSGKVINKFYQGDPDGPKHFTILELLERPGGEVPVPYTTREAKHLRVTSSATPDVLRWNIHVKLLLDIDLPPKTHVYSPSVQGGYIPIDWKMAGGSSKVAGGFPKFSGVKYPAAEMLHVDILNETLSVYQSHFQLARDVIVGDEQQMKPLLNERGEANFEGTLRYQACDDHECYIPETVPLKWALRFEQRDPGRPPSELQHKVKLQDTLLSFTYDNKTKKLRFSNDGRTNVTVWGLVLNDDKKFDFNDRRIMNPAMGIEMAGDDLFAWISLKTPKGSNTQYPVRIFVKNGSGDEFVMHSSFGVTWEHDTPVIGTQTGSIVAEQWSRSMNPGK